MMFASASDPLGHIPDDDGYLQRMAAALAQKVDDVADYIRPGHRDILDVGCADGCITQELSRGFPQANFLGIDLKENFVSRAKQTNMQSNLAFRRSFLRDLLAEEQRYDVVMFCSVLHEFYSYGSGRSSVAKALADAHELLKPGGVLIIRDMILNDYSKRAQLHVPTIAAKLEAHSPQLVADFESCFGKLDSLYNVNHLLLKYMYSDNWSRECGEHYVPITFEDYQKIFEWLGLRLEVMRSSTLPYLAQRWNDDLALTPDEIADLRTTGVLVATKL